MHVKLQEDGIDDRILFSVKYYFWHHKPWFDEECLHFLDQRIKAKMRGVQDPSQSNVDNLNNLRHELEDISETKRHI